MTLDGGFTRRGGRCSTRHRRLLSRWRAGRDTCQCWPYLPDSTWLRVESSSPPAEAVRFVRSLWPGSAPHEEVGHQERRESEDYACPDVDADQDNRERPTDVVLEIDISCIV